MGKVGSRGRCSSCKRVKRYGLRKTEPEAGGGLGEEFWIAVVC